MTANAPEMAPESASAPDLAGTGDAAAPAGPPALDRFTAKAPPISTADRLAALVEVVACSGFPTQLALGPVLGALGLRPEDAAGHLSRAWVVTVSLADAALVIGLILWLLRVHGESPAAIFLGGRRVAGEALIGLPLVPVAFLFVALVMGGLLALAPWLHNVPRSPFQDMIRTPGDAWQFALVVIVSGGFREEIQRAFVLRRFEQYLGGPWVGLAAFSMAFGAGHVIQGWDVAVTIALLGAFWGILYLRRRSIVAPVVCHGGFNLIEVFRYTLSGL